MNIKRSVRLFFVSYGRLIFTIIAFLAIFIYALHSLDEYVGKTYIKNELTEEEKSILEEQNEKVKENKKYISEIIDYCNNKEITKAYNMLSDKCKNEKYRTIDEFQINFIKKYFSLNISEYKIEKNKNDYIVSLTQDMLITGKTESSIYINIKIIDLRDKIYIKNK